MYAVPGNHDYWEGLADVRAALALAGCGGGVGSGDDEVSKSFAPADDKWQGEIYLAWDYSVYVICVDGAP